MKTTINIKVDAAISVWNKNNPEKRKMTRQTLIEKLDNKITIPTIQNWKKGNVPNALKSIYEILEITGCSLMDLIGILEDGKRV